MNRKGKTLRRLFASHKTSHQAFHLVVSHPYRLAIVTICFCIVLGFPCVESVFLDRSHIYSCKHCLSNVPDETIVKVTFMNGKLEKSVVLPKGLYLNYLYLSIYM